MTASNFTIGIHEIRNAIKHANRDLLTNKPVNTAELHDRIKTLTDIIHQQAGGLDASMKDTLAADLTVLTQELDSLEKMIEQHLNKEAD